MARDRYAWVAVVAIVLAVLVGWAWKNTRASQRPAASGIDAVAPVAQASPRAGAAAQPDAANTAGPLAQGDPAVRANLLLESRFVLAGSVNGDAVIKALSPEQFQDNADLMAAASQGNAGLAARNAAMRDAMAKTLAGIDADAELALLECSERLCVMEVHPAAGAANADYAGKLVDALGNRYGESRVMVTMPVTSADGMFYRNFFTLGPGLRSVRGPAP